MIGLKRRTVKLLSYHKKWELLFGKEKNLFEKKLGDLVVAIEHIGSTSIPGIPAKPIIDISMGVRMMRDSKKLIKPLKELGYELRRAFGKPNIQILFVKGAESNRTHYLHVMDYNGGLWKNDLLFRDYLRSHPKHAQQYAELKKNLAEKHANDRRIYTQSKSVFILETIQIAQKD